MKLIVCCCLMKYTISGDFLGDLEDNVNDKVDEIPQTSAHYFLHELSIKTFRIIFTIYAMITRMIVHCVSRDCLIYTSSVVATVFDSMVPVMILFCFFIVSFH